jgi:hypothetical protein
MNQLVPFRSAAACRALMAAAGEGAKLRFVEFFTANIRNRNTRRAYAQAVAEFLAWCEDHRVPSIAAVQPVLTDHHAVLNQSHRRLGGRTAA